MKEKNNFEVAKKTRVAVFAGARSTEHEVSLASAYNITNAIDRNKYEVYVVGIDKSGVWRQYDPENFVENPSDFTKIKLATPISGRLTVTQCSNAFYDLDDGAKVAFECDVIFPAVLGNYAEDGTMQGLIRMMDVPFATPDVLGSSVGMDKDVSYRLLRDAGLNVGKFATFRKHENDQPSFEVLSRQLGAKVLFVKPANTGSSVGVSRVTNTAELEKAIKLAYKYDTKVMVQEGLVGREVEISVMGNFNTGLKTSVVGEIVEKDPEDFYSYDNKYIHSDNVDLRAPADLPKRAIEEIKRVAVRVCEVLECEGFGRVDFFYSDDGRVFVNEINTMPGFTQISMFPRLWGESGVSYPELIDVLLQNAIERYEYRIKPIVVDAEDVIRLAAGEQAMGEIVEEEVSLPVKILAGLYKRLGRLYVKIKRPIVICVAGSVGKTTTKLALAKVLETEKKVSYMDDSYNEGLGLYMSAFEQKVPSNLKNPLLWVGKLLGVLGKFIMPAPEILILEYGIDRVGTMDRLISYIRPDIGMLTAVTPEHMELLFNMNVVGQEETKILRMAKKSGFVNTTYVAEKHLKDIKTKLYKYGSVDSGVNHKIQEWTSVGAKVDFDLGGKLIKDVDLRFIFEPQISQLSGVALLADHLGVSKQGIRKGLNQIRPFNSRMSLLEGRNESSIIDDAANFSPDAGVAALKTLKRIPAGRRIAVLGNMHELGEYEEKGFSDVAAEFKNLDMLIFVGELAEKYFVPMSENMGFKKDKNLFVFENSPKAGIWLREKLQKNDVVLVKGPFGRLFMEETVKKLLANSDDVKYVTRQSEFWQRKKRAKFGDLLDN